MLSTAGHLALRECNRWIFIVFWQALHAQTISGTHLLQSESAMLKIPKVLAP